jgi:integrin beta 3
MMDLQEAFDAGFVAVKAYVDGALAEQAKTLPLLVKAAVADAVRALPPPCDGADGKDAEPVSGEQIGHAVRDYLAANPPAAGQDGREGVDGKDGQDGAPGEKGQDGADGVGLAAALIDKAGDLVITTTKGEAIRLGKVEGRDGKDGAPGDPGQKGDPGRDGLDLTHFDTSLSEDGRVLTLSLESDEIKVTHELELGGMIYRGVFSDDQAYVKGDTVTWGGSLYIAKGPTSEKPDASKEWALAAKKGRDGRDGSPGKDGERGLPGLNGKDSKPW